MTISVYAIDLNSTLDRIKTNSFEKLQLKKL